MKVYSVQASSRAIFAAFALLVSVIAVYSPGLHGPFVFDDEIHILSDPSIRMSSVSIQDIINAVAAGDGSILRRPLAKISLAFNYYLSAGTSSAFGYKLTNLGIHLVNTGLVYWFSLLLLRQRTRNQDDPIRIAPGWLPMLVAGLWALHPLHLTSVLYVVQRMTSLAALFVLAGLIVYVHGRRRIHEQRDHGYTLMFAGAIGGLILGLACKENAVVLLPLMLVIEYVFFGTASEAPSDRHKLRWFYGFLVLAPAAFLGAWLIAHPDFILSPYLSRNFTPAERLLTESRVLWYYVGLLFIPDVRKLSLYHDDITISRGIFDPWTTSIAMLSIISIVIFALIARRKYPLISFAILWFLVGHSIESSIIGLEIAHEHRNYLPDIGILLAVGYALSTFALKYRKPIRNALLLTPLITLGFATNTLAKTWASEEGIISSLVRNHPGSARGHYMQAELYAERKHDLAHALVHYRRAAELAPDETGYLVKSALATAIMESGLDNDIGAAPTNTNGKDIDAKTRTAPSDAGTAALHRGYAAIANKVTTNEIGFRLKERPLTPITLHILDELASCTNQESPVCRTMYPHIKNWYLAVIQNPYLGSKERGNFIIYLFNIGIARPDFDLSLQAAGLGRKVEPSNPVYSLMEANVYMLRGELETADAILQSVAQGPTGRLTAGLRENINTLSAQIELRKANTRSNRIRRK